MVTCADSRTGAGVSVIGPCVGSMCVVEADRGHEIQVQQFGSQAMNFEDRKLRSGFQ